MHELVPWHEWLILMYMRAQSSRMHEWARISHMTWPETPHGVSHKACESWLRFCFLCDVAPCCAHKKSESWLACLVTPKTWHDACDTTMTPHGGCHRACESWFGFLMCARRGHITRLISIYICEWDIRICEWFVTHDLWLMTYYSRLLAQILRVRKNGLHHTTAPKCPWLVCVPWLMRMCDMNLLYVWHDSLVCVTWLIRVCDMTRPHVSHDSFVRVPWLIRTCDITPSFTHVTGLIRMCAMIHSYVCHDSFARVHICTCAMTHSYGWHDSYVRVIWLTYQLMHTGTNVPMTSECAMTHP